MAPLALGADDTLDEEATEADDGALLTVKRRLLPNTADASSDASADGDPSLDAAASKRESAAAKRAEKKRFKIRRGGTVEGSTRTIFDEEGNPLSRRLEGFAGVVADKAGAREERVVDPEDRAEKVRSALKAAAGICFSPIHPFLPYVAPHFSHISPFLFFAATDRQRERERVREKHRKQKKQVRSLHSGPCLAQMSQPVFSLGVTIHVMSRLRCRFELLFSQRKEASGEMMGGEAEAEGGGGATVMLGGGGESDGGGGSADEGGQRGARAKGANATLDSDEQRAEALLSKLLNK